MFKRILSSIALIITCSCFLTFVNCKEAYARDPYQDTVDKFWNEYNKSSKKIEQIGKQYKDSNAKQIQKDWDTLNKLTQSTNKIIRTVDKHTQQSILKTLKFVITKKQNSGSNIILSGYWYNGNKTYHIGQIQSFTISLYDNSKLIGNYKLSSSSIPAFIPINYKAPFNIKLKVSKKVNLGTMKYKWSMPNFKYYLRSDLQENVNAAMDQFYKYQGEKLIDASSY